MLGARVLAVGVGYLGLVAAALFFLLPLLWIILTSLKTPEQLFQYPPRWWPERPTLENYAYLFSKMPFLRYSFNSLKVAALSTLGSVASCSLAAYAFTRLRFAGRTPLFYLLLATLMIPYQVTMIPVFILMRSLGWVDTYYPLIVPWFLGGAFGTFLLRQFFKTLPVELEDAARVDSASEVQILWHIMLPLSGPALAVLGLLLIHTVFFTPQSENLSYRDFKTLLKAGKVIDLLLWERTITGRLSTNGLEGLLPPAKIEDVDGTLGEEALRDINALRMRTQEGFPNFGEVDDATNFEQIQRGLVVLDAALHRQVRFEQQSVRTPQRAPAVTSSEIAHRLKTIAGDPRALLDLVLPHPARAHLLHERDLAKLARDHERDQRRGLALSEQSLKR